MDNLNLIAAIGPNRELGYKNQLLWHIKEDLLFYKEMTMNKNIIMGRKTLESMPNSALIGRKPIILTRSFIESNGYIKYFNNIENLLSMIKNSKEEFMVVGGASIYEQFLPLVDRMYLTFINDNKSHQVDCYFPSFDNYDWSIELLKEGKEKDVSYQIKKYVRKR